MTPDVLVLAAAVAVGVACGFRWRRARYPRAVLWARDVEINAATGGGAKQTISDTVGDAYRRGRWWAKVLNVLSLGHFKATNEAGRQRDGFFATSRGLLVMLVAATLWYYARWRWPVLFVRHLETPYLVLLVAWLLTQQAVKPRMVVVPGLTPADRSTVVVMPWVMSVAAGIITWLTKVKDAPRWAWITAVAVLAFLLFMVGWHFFGGEP